MLPSADMRQDTAGAAPTPESHEQALVLAVQAGDPAAFEHVVRTYGGRLLAVTRRILRDEEDARDAVQDAFISAFKARSSFEGGARVSTWLHRIAVNSALMRLRSRKRRPEQSMDELLPTFKEDGHHVQQFETWAEPVDETLGREATRAAVRAAIDQLPEQYRTVVLLRDIEEWSTEEAATALGITPNAVKIRLHRARLALRTLIAPHFQGAQS